MPRRRQPARPRDRTPHRGCPPEPDTGRHRRLVAPLAFIALIAIPGCTALEQLAALRSVTFAFAGLSDVRLAGIRIGAGTSYASLSLSDVANLTAAVIAKEVPIEFVAHVNATNPPDNKVTARMVEMGWTLFIEDRRTLAGQLGSAVTIAPGTTSDVPLSARFDLLQLGSGGARDLFDLAVAISGHGSVQKDLRLELVPTIETSLGPIRYPAPVVVRRAAAAR